MNENNNYFGDITELFLKAKKEENIDVNPQAKNAIREMILHKSKPAPTESVWRKWKYQFVGVPASLMALVVIVYAATNLNFSLPTEDFTPEVFDSVLQTDEIAEEEVVEEENIPGESDNAFLWVIPSDETDPRELRTPRTLNKIVPKVTETPASTPAPVVESAPAEEDSGLDFSIFDDAMNFVVPDKEEPAEDPPAETPAAEAPTDPVTQPSTGGSPGEATPALPATTEPQEPTPEKQADTPAETSDALAQPAPPPPPTTTNQDQMSTGMLTHQEDTSLRAEYTESENVFERQETKDEFTIYYYFVGDLEKAPDFNEKLLAKILSSGEPTSATVYYISETKVVVEVAYGDFSKWYLITKIEGNWTIQKYEKEMLAGVVK